ncbi:MAG: hypothetical protein M3179_04990, partial [Actinomycetota bacterium]|nr:hypothetical protein [Actinomycetota bacterium]
AEQGTPVEVEERTIRVLEETRGDPGLVVLRVLGVAQAAAPVGAAARGPGAVAAGVWRNPELYLARWLNGRRWIVGYRLTGASRISDYVRTEGHVPTRLETCHWYGAAPDEVSEAFFDAGILLDDPPYPVPAPPPRPTRAAAGPVIRAPRAPRASASRAAARSVPKPKPPTTRVCPSCQMHKALTQYDSGSDLCVDCR